jgi:hypothetical protein
MTLSVSIYVLPSVLCTNLSLFCRVQLLLKRSKILIYRLIIVNGKHYVQTEVTAIGSHSGMNYASVYLGSWEKNIV